MNEFYEKLDKEDTNIFESLGYELFIDIKESLYLNIISSLNKNELINIMHVLTLNDTLINNT
jgi:hypothetical protein